MPNYAVICIDKPGSLALRVANRDAHLAYIAQTGVVVQAGPFLGDDEGMIGSLLILDVADRAAAADWGANDPYFKAGLFESVQIHRWKKVVG